MGLLECIIFLWNNVGHINTAISLASNAKKLADYLKTKIKLENVLADLVSDEFHKRVQYMRNLCPDGEPEFYKNTFLQAITNHDFQVRTPDDLVPQLLPYLVKATSTPGSPYGDSEWNPIYQSVLKPAVRGMWKKIAGYSYLADQISLEQGELIINNQDELSLDVANGFSRVESSLDEIINDIKYLVKFAKDYSAKDYNQLVAIAPPSEQMVYKEVYPNPFALVRSEDFNHNYKKLAELFQDSPTWDSIQSRIDNVFIEGGRGTGKSMLLRRLSAQATIAASRLTNPNATFEDITVEYFGVYIKLFRGSYERIDSIGQNGPQVTIFLAQQQLNVEIFDAFVETLQWLDKEQALPNLRTHLRNIVKELASLFPKAPQDVRTLDDLRNIIFNFEQSQINAFLTAEAFGYSFKYEGSSISTPAFIQRLSRICRDDLFPDREMRLFLLIDEFEALLDIQQMALNTVIKNRFPDVTLKIAVRRLGRKTSETFSKGDPIQDPRDYREVRLELDADPVLYEQLLEGIATKRLKEAKYSEDRIRMYLSKPTSYEEIPGKEIESELRKIWENTKHLEMEISDDFRKRYYITALYRALSHIHKRKAFVGFEEYALLSSGIVSNFIELCKYAFYFALSDELPLRENPAIPTYLQIEAAYRVSGRFFEKIDGNVPNVGSTLATLLFYLGKILKSRLLYHDTEPEVSRLELQDYDKLSLDAHKTIMTVIEGGSIWSVLHLKTSKDGFHPDDSAQSPTAEIVINRIYSPFLGISPFGKWKVKITLSELESLLNHNTKDDELANLLKTIGAEDLG